MITISILIALAVNGLMLNPAYQWCLNKLRMDAKPWNCLYCLSFHIGWIAGITAYGIPGLVLVPLAATFIAVAFSRWFDSLPTKFK